MVLFPRQIFCPQKHSLNVPNHTFFMLLSRQIDSHEHSFIRQKSNNPTGILNNLFESTKTLTFSPHDNYYDPVKTRLVGYTSVISNIYKFVFINHFT